MSVQLIEGSPSHFLPSEIQEAIGHENPSKLFALFSGGHDSLCSTHIASSHPLFSGVIHCNTGIGIEQTRDYVRQTCEDRHWPLYELHAQVSYEDLVLKRGGFPSGPQSHASFYWFLKQKQLRAFVQSRKRRSGDRIALVTGIRKGESVRRMAAAMAVSAKRDGAYLWLNPILEWTQRDKSAYMEKWELPRNLVVDLLHRSGECLCGALARREELVEIAEWFDQEAQRIYALEERVKAAGLDDHFWAMRSPVSADQMELSVGPMCVGCEARA